MSGRDLRLLPLAVAVWVTALLGVMVPGLASWLAAGCGAGALVCGTAAVVRARRGWRHDARAGGAGGVVLLLLSVCAAVALSVTFADAGRQQAAQHDGRVIEVAAEVTSSASRGADGRLWVDAQTTSVTAGDEHTPLAVPIRVGIDPADGADLGATIRVRGEARRTDAGERAVLVLFSAEASVERPAGGVFRVAADLRRVFIDRATALPEPGAGLLPGLAVGDTRAVPDALAADMRVTGLSHLTAVSGANCAIVVGAVFWLVALCGGGRRVRIVVSASALAGFVVLVTPEPSVIRAAVMAGVSMIALLLGRPSAGAGILAVTASLVLLCDPWLAAAPGFALSVAASGALILLARPLGRGLGRALPGPLAAAVSVPLAAQLVCGPIVALFAEQQSLLGVLTNLVAAPAAPIATVGGLLACLAGPVPWLAHLLAASAWLPAAWIATTAHVGAGLPAAQVTLVPGWGSAVIVAVISAALGVVLCGRAAKPASRRERRSEGRDEGRDEGRGEGRDDGASSIRMPPLRRLGELVHPLSVLVLVVAASLGAAHVALSGPLASMAAPADWAIAACDVGQGDALLVRSAGQVALIDTGPEPEALTECLRGLAVDRIDLLVLTHFDLDHVGGVEAVQGRVGKVLHGPPADDSDERILNALGAAGAEVVSSSAGMQGTLGRAQWRLLWPLADSRVFPSGNDASVVVQFEGGDVPRSLFLGDLSAEAQRMLVRAEGPTGPFAVVKVAHHGSADQDPGLYDTLRPAVAVFSAGVGNDYGHPRQVTLDLLAATGAHIVRTDTDGRILLGLAGAEVTIRTESDVGSPR